MKLSKSFLLGTAIALTMSSFSLSAVTPEELTDTIRASRTCPAPQIPAPEAEQGGWFSSFRAAASSVAKAAAATLFNAGEVLRTPSNNSAASQATKLVADGAISYASKQTGLPFYRDTEKVSTFIGNGFRKFSVWLSPDLAPQTTTRIIFKKLELKQDMQSDEVAQTLKTVALANLKADEGTAYREYKAVAEGMVKRGYARVAQVNELDIHAIYVKALAKETFSANQSYEDFAHAVKVKGFEVLENIKSVKAAPLAGDQLQAMDQHLKAVYDQITLEQGFDNMRRNAIAAPAE